MSTSLNLKSPISVTPSTYKSNFRRTSSLRVPKKTPKTLSYSMPKYKPTIQRGISDEGPISSNFIKPEEYDELPVKSQAIVTPDLVPKSPSHRELSAAVIKRDHSASANRRNLRLDLKNVPGHPDFSLSKTDSLAAFLKFEKELNCEPNNEIINNNIGTNRLSEKELKDKSNSLSKKSLDRSSFADLLDSKIEFSDENNRIQEPQPDLIFSPKHHNSIKLAPIENTGNKLYNRNLNSVITFSQNKNALAEDKNTKLLNASESVKISDCSKFLPHSTSSSSYESNDLTKPITALMESVDNMLANNQLQTINRLPSAPKIETSDSRSSSTEKRSLRRQLKFNKDNFLYDNDAAIIDTDVDNVICNDTAVAVADDKKREDLPQTINTSVDNTAGNQNRMLGSRGPNLDSIEKLFDDFDLEEFISSFDDDEKYPIFKNYKEHITSRSPVKNERPSQSNDVSSDDSLTSDERMEQKQIKDSINNDVGDVNIVSTNIFTSVSSPTENSPKSPVHQISHAKLYLPKNPLTDKKAFSNEELDSNFDTNKNGLPPIDVSKEKDSPNNYISRMDPMCIDDSDMSPAERELLESVQELNRMCDSVTTFQLDSGDELSSVDSYPFAKSLGSKFSIDSAYGRYKCTSLSESILCMNFLT